MHGANSWQTDAALEFSSKQLIFLKFLLHLFVAMMPNEVSLMAASLIKHKSDGVLHTIRMLEGGSSVSWHLFPAVFLSLAFNFNSYLLGLPLSFLSSGICAVSVIVSSVLLERFRCTLLWLQVPELERNEGSIKGLT